MIETAEAARAAAAGFLRHIEPEVGEPIAITAVTEFPTCWVVGYNTIAFLQGDFSHALAGGPMIINRLTGHIRFGLSYLAAEEQLDPE